MQTAKLIFFQGLRFLIFFFLFLIGTAHLRNFISPPPRTHYSDLIVKTYRDPFPSATTSDWTENWDSGVRNNSNRPRRGWPCRCCPVLLLLRRRRRGWWCSTKSLQWCHLATKRRACRPRSNSSAWAACADGRCLRAGRSGSANCDAETEDLDGYYAKHMQISWLFNPLIK